MNALVSIVMPAYNAEPFIADAIRSVLAQQHTNWELVIVNDASTDGTAREIAQFNDPRIHVFHMERNGGIGRSRNVALEHINGSFLCTLDSDDVLPANSISSRLDLMEREPDVDFADGVVQVYDRGLNGLLRSFTPTFEGEPLDDLLALKGTCFFGPSWMIRWNAAEHMTFNTDISHAEDLLFYLSIAKGHKYKAVQETVLHYRVTGTSAMSDLEGLGRSYRYIARWLRDHPEFATREQARRFSRKSRSIMFKTFLKARRPWDAFVALLTQ